MNTIKTTPKDFFLHLAATAFLYAVIISLVSLVTALINYSFPDALAGYYYGNSTAWPISMLIVLTPVLYLTGWFIRKDIAAVPEKAGLWVRRWRIDLTIFLAAIVLVGDLVALINTYINGEISERFVWKFVAFLLIFGVTFAYYLLERLQIQKQTRTILAWAGVVMVLAAIIWGFMVVGSPQKQRDLRFDAQRVNDLQTIQWQIISHWQNKEKLPATLAELADPISGNRIPMDPETKKAYEYTATSTVGFELCATFARPTQDTKGRGEFYGGGSVYMPVAIDASYPYPGETMDTNWKHETGRTCFARTIDPDRYPPSRIMKGL